MQLVGENPTKLRCEHEEELTVEVNANEDVAEVRYSLNAATWDGGTFTVRMTNPPKPPNIPSMSLVIGVIYSGASGGAATITITGSKGGEPSIVELEQAPAIEGLEEEASDIANYRIFI